MCDSEFSQQYYTDGLRTTGTKRLKNPIHQFKKSAVHREKRTNFRTRIGQRLFSYSEKEDNVYTSHISTQSNDRLSRAVNETHYSTLNSQPIDTNLNQCKSNFTAPFQPDIQLSHDKLDLEDSDHLIATINNINHQPILSTDGNDINSMPDYDAALLAGFLLGQLSFLSFNDIYSQLINSINHSFQTFIGQDIYPSINDSTTALTLHDIMTFLKDIKTHFLNDLQQATTEKPPSIVMHESYHSSLTHQLQYNELDNIQNDSIIQQSYSELDTHYTRLAIQEFTKNTFFWNPKKQESIPPNQTNKNVQHSDHYVPMTMNFRYETTRPCCQFNQEYPYTELDQSMIPNDSYDNVPKLNMLPADSDTLITHKIPLHMIKQFIEQFLCQINQHSEYDIFSKKSTDDETEHSITYLQLLRQEVYKQFLLRVNNASSCMTEYSLQKNLFEHITHNAMYKRYYYQDENPSLCVGKFKLDFAYLESHISFSCLHKLRHKYQYQSDPLPIVLPQQHVPPQVQYIPKTTPRFLPPCRRSLRLNPLGPPPPPGLRRLTKKELMDSGIDECHYLQKRHYEHNNAPQTHVDMMVEYIQKSIYGQYNYLKEQDNSNTPLFNLPTRHVLQTDTFNDLKPLVNNCSNSSKTIWPPWTYKYGNPCFLIQNNGYPDMNEQHILIKDDLKLNQFTTDHLDDICLQLDNNDLIHHYNIRHNYISEHPLICTFYENKHQQFKKCKEFLKTAEEYQERLVSLCYILEKPAFPGLEELVNTLDKNNDYNRQHHSTPFKVNTTTIQPIDQITPTTTTNYEEYHTPRLLSIFLEPYNTKEINVLELRFPLDIGPFDFPRDFDYAYLSTDASMTLQDENDGNQNDFDCFITTNDQRSISSPECLPNTITIDSVILWDNEYITGSKKKKLEFHAYHLIIPVVLEYSILYGTLDDKKKPLTNSWIVLNHYDFNLLDQKIKSGWGNNTSVNYKRYAVQSNIIQNTQYESITSKTSCEPPPSNTLFDYSNIHSFTNCSNSLTLNRLETLCLYNTFHNQQYPILPLDSPLLSSFTLQKTHHSTNSFIHTQPIVSSSSFNVLDHLDQWRLQRHLSQYTMIQTMSSPPYDYTTLCSISDLGHDHSHMMYSAELHFDICRHSLHNFSMEELQLLKETTYDDTLSCIEEDTHHLMMIDASSPVSASVLSADSQLLKAQHYSSLHSLINDIHYNGFHDLLTKMKESRYYDSLFNNLDSTLYHHLLPYCQTSLPACVLLLIHFCRERFHTVKDVLSFICSSKKRDNRFSTLEQRIILLTIERLYDQIINLSELTWEKKSSYPPTQFTHLITNTVTTESPADTLSYIIYWLTFLNTRQYFNPVCNEREMTLKERVLSRIRYHSTPTLLQIIFKSVCELNYSNKNLPPIVISLWLMFCLGSHIKGKRLYNRLLCLLPWPISTILALLWGIIHHKTSLLFMTPKAFHKSSLLPDELIFEKRIASIYRQLPNIDMYHYHHCNITCQWCQTFGLGDLLNQTNDIDQTMPLCLNKHHDLFHIDQKNLFNNILNLVSKRQSGVSRRKYIARHHIL